MNKAYFITGNAGTGKSTVVQRLRESGYTAFDIDETPLIHGYLDRQTGEITDTLAATDLSGEAAFARYASIIKSGGLKMLLAQHEQLFLAGSTSNQEDFYPLFSKIIGLVLEKPELERRLRERTNNTTGNSPEERSYLLRINDRVNANLVEKTTIIDASQPIDIVTQEVLQSTVYSN